MAEILECSLAGSCAKAEKSLQGNIASLKKISSIKRNALYHHHMARSL